MSTFICEWPMYGGIYVDFQACWGSIVCWIKSSTWPQWGMKSLQMNRENLWVSTGFLSHEEIRIMIEWWEFYHVRVGKLSAVMDWRLFWILIVKGMLYSDNTERLLVYCLINSSGLVVYPYMVSSLPNKVKESCSVSSNLVHVVHVWDLSSQNERKVTCGPKAREKQHLLQNAIFCNLPPLSMW